MAIISRKTWIVRWRLCADVLKKCEIKESDAQIS